jgi:hypothetical protein
MACEGDLTVVDLVQAQLVECAPDPDAVEAIVTLRQPMDASPVAEAMTATIEQTGADPPPRVTHG